MNTLDPARYDAWYDTGRGRWMVRREAALLLRLFGTERRGTLLDVGAGTGRFSRAFAAAGFQVTALDQAPAMLAFARSRNRAAAYVRGDALHLPFPDRAFDCCAAVTSLCFVPDPAAALREMWRVCRRTVVLGLLNRRSRLHRQKAASGGYLGARWDDAAAVTDWAAGLNPRPRTTIHTALFSRAAALPLALPRG